MDWNLRGAFGRAFAAALAFGRVSSIDRESPMQTEHAWQALVELAPQLKREFWFTAIRFIVVATLISGAAWLMATAYAPQPAVPVLASQPVSCPPDVVAREEAAISPQTVAVTQAAAASLTNSPALFDKSPARSCSANEQTREQVRRSGAKKPVANAVARNPVAPKRVPAAEVKKRGPNGTNQKPKRSTYTAMLAQSADFRSPFSDTHGQ